MNDQQQPTPTQLKYRMPILLLGLALITAAIWTWAGYRAGLLTAGTMLCGLSLERKTGLHGLQNVQLIALIDALSQAKDAALKQKEAEHRAEQLESENIDLRAKADPITIAGRIQVERFKERRRCSDIADNADSCNVAQEISRTPAEERNAYETYLMRNS